VAAKVIQKIKSESQRKVCPWCQLTLYVRNALFIKVVKSPNLSSHNFLMPLAAFIARYLLKPISPHHTLIPTAPPPPHQHLSHCEDTLLQSPYVVFTYHINVGPPENSPRGS
jgi:hypothetical protein